MPSDYAGRKILVTGADGFIGSHLVESLVGEGSDVTALAHYNSFDSCGWLDELGAPVLDGIRVARGDVRDRNFVFDLVDGQEVVFHLAALIGIPYSYSAPQSYTDVNITGTLNVMDAARNKGVSRVVHTSTSEVYGTALYEPIDEKHPLQAQSPYAASKIGADMMALAYANSFDLPVVVLRPFNTFGPRQSEREVIPTIVRQVLDPSCSEIQIGDDTPRRDFSFVQDTVAAFLSIGLADNPEWGGPYNAGSGRAVTIAALIDEILALTDCSKAVQVAADRFRPERSEVGALLADADRFRDLTGWKPKFDLRAGLLETIDWWRPRFEKNLIRRSSSFSI